MKKKFLKNTTKEALVGYAFIGIWIVGFIWLTAIPLIRSLIFSMSNVSITGAQGIVVTTIGFGNYIRIFTTDVNFIDDVITFVQQIILYVPIILIISMLIAILLNQKIRFRGFFRSIFFLPVIIASGPVINELVSQGAGTVPLIEQYGMLETINQVLPSFIAEPIGMLFSEMIMVLWFSGVQIVLFLAGLQKISTEIYEAARVDGASPWESFWKITLPSLKNIILVSSIYTIVMLSTFANNPIISRIRLMMFDSQGGYGYASAMAWIYFILITIILGVFALIIAFPKKEDRVKGGKKYVR
ncbi:MAG: sugar ABC transporter permease [Acholeplasmataceae bacterium]|nr:sugar ABC transporter permease [Acholeplasmataceae bacterium]